MDIQNSDRVEALTLPDGSMICELLSYRNSCLRNQSLGASSLPVGCATIVHFHPSMEEIYYILEGSGRMQVGEHIADVEVGDAIAIPPGSKHQLTNTGEIELKFLFSCAPAFEQEQVVLA